MKTAAEFAAKRIADLTDEECREALVVFVEAALLCDNESPHPEAGCDWGDFPQYLECNETKSLVRPVCRVEINHPEIEADVLAAAHEDDEIVNHLTEVAEAYGDGGVLNAFFEHGSWHVEALSGRQWSAHNLNDDEYTFEQVSHGNQEFS